MKKNVILIGGTGHLGSEICRVLSEADGEVRFTYFQNVETAKNLETRYEYVRGFKCDVTNEKEVINTIKKMAEGWNSVDALVFAHGPDSDSVFHDRDPNFDSLAEIRPTQYLEMNLLNSYGTFVVCQAVLPLMKTKGGNIVLLGSLAGHKAIPGPVHFSASKAALKGLTEALSKELGVHNVKVNLIALGLLTGGGSSGLSENHKKIYIKHSAIGRLAESSEVAETVSYFAFENTYVTGQSIVMDGGL